MKYLILLVLLSSCSGAPMTLCSLNKIGSPYKEAIESYPLEKKAFFYSCIGIELRHNCNQYDYCLRKYSDLGVKQDNTASAITNGAAIIGTAHVVGSLLR
jgi:hypothetical protein